LREISELSLPICDEKASRASAWAKRVSAYFRKIRARTGVEHSDGWSAELVQS
jgi:hypothetical protein